MRKRMQSAFVLSGITLGLAVAPVMAQSDDAKAKISTISQKDKMMAMSKMSKDEKAAMFDQMSEVDKMKATKMATDRNRKDCHLGQPHVDRLRNGYRRPC